MFLIDNVMEKSFFITSNCWAFVTYYKDENKNVTKYYTDKLEDAKRSDCRYIHFPIDTPGRNYKKGEAAIHWSLMVYDKKKNEWMYYNSLRPSAVQKSDYYFNHSKKVAEHATNYWNKMDGNEKEILPIYNYIADSPQQGSGTNDCAIFVMKIMQYFVKGEKIPSKWQANEIMQTKIEILSKILFHKNSFNVQDYLDCLQAALVPDHEIDVVVSNICKDVNKELKNI